jgi:hypothetical protein
VKIQPPSVNNSVTALIFPVPSGANNSYIDIVRLFHFCGCSEEVIHGGTDPGAVLSVTGAVGEVEKIFSYGMGEEIKEEENGRKLHGEVLRCRLEEWW